MIKRQGIRLLVINDGSTEMRSLKFSKARIISTVLIIVVLLGGFTYTASRLLAWKFTQAAMSKVMSENRDLKRNIDRISERLQAIDGQLTELTTSDDNLRILADMPKIDDDVRQVGIGGVANPVYDYADENQTVRQLIFDLDKLEREIRLQHQSFSEIRDQLNDRQDLLTHTPSIRPLHGGYISSKFGRRPDPFTHRWTQHNGVDFAGERGSPILATADGEVVYAKQAHGMGKLVVIDHGFGYRTAYGHMDDFSVRKGQKVKRGDKVGELGNTGRSTGPHLHYEVHLDKLAVDPMDYFFEGIVSIEDIE